MLLTLPSGPTLRPSKILCIGRNYAEHVREMGDVPELPAEPVVFLKPPSALVGTGGEIVLPAQSAEVHHELEVVAVIGRAGKNISMDRAADYLAAFALGLDLTARDVQRRAKEARAPWALAKGFDTFAPLGPLTPAPHVPGPQAIEFQLAVNGELRQAGSTREMIFSFAFLVAFLSRVFTLEPGDLIFSGTPSGVGLLQPGDVLEATSPSLRSLRLTVRKDGGGGKGES